MHGGLSANGLSDILVFLNEWYVVFATFLFKFVYGMHVICRKVLAYKSCFFSS